LYRFLVAVLTVGSVTSVVVAQAPAAPPTAAPAAPPAAVPAAPSPETLPAQPGQEPPIGPIDVQAPATPPAPAASAPPAAAAEPEEPFDPKLEIQNLRDDQRGLQTDLENFKFQWQREIDLHTATTTRFLLINGVVQTRFGWTSQEVTNNVVYGRKSSFDVGAANVAFSGLLYRDYQEGRNLTYMLRVGASPQTNTNNSFLNLLDASIAYSLMPTVDREAPVLTVTAGQQLLPFGLEVPATEELKPLIRNAEFTTRLNLAQRDMGLIVRGDLVPRVDYGYNYRQALLAYALGVTNGAGPNIQDDNDRKDIIGRLAFTLPADYNSWLRQITIGGTALIGARNTYLTDPAKTLSGKGVKNRYGIDFYYNHWPFGITYEFVSSRDAVTTGTTLNDPKRDEIVANSHTATLFLSFGEQFVAGFRQQGRYDDWWPKTWQPFARFDYFDRDIRKDKKNDRIGVLTFGLNVFFAETTKFQLNYNIRRDESLPKDKRTAHEILAQLQFGF
jgi:hypothetical protein